MPQCCDVTLDEEAWVAEISGGNHRAFARLFQVYYAGLCRFVKGYVRSSAVAEDLVQNVFMDIWERRHQWAVRRSLKAYLYGAARNQALMYLRHEEVRRRSKRQQRSLERVGEADVEVALYDKELQALVQHAIDILPERRRQIFLLSRRHDLTYAEIATVLGISVKTVETQMGRALGFLRERLAPHLFEHALPVLAVSCLLHFIG